MTEQNEHPEQNSHIGDDEDRRLSDRRKADRRSANIATNNCRLKFSFIEKVLRTESIDLNSSDRHGLGLIAADLIRDIQDIPVGCCQGEGH